MKRAMKHSGTRRLWLCAMLVLALVFTLASCGGGGGGSDSPGGGTTTRLSGTYRTPSDPFGSGAITFSGSNFTMNAQIFGMSITARGNYTISGGTTLTLTTTQANDGSVGEVSVWTIVDSSTLLDDKGDYWRK